ncbi:thioredoxin domain-containing protein [Nocardia sp. NPDC050712]|uniref:thioredoxin family protein n=1 Tax=Nocardia sp. NPDC050712 TaxID=3155518 RepID=UPI0033EEAC73
MTDEAVIRVIGDAEFETAVLAAPGPVVVEFFAPWCGSCRRLAPILDAVAAEYSDRVRFLEIDADINPETVARYRITSTPTLIGFRDGTDLAMLTGAQSAETLRGWVAELAGAPARDAADLLEPSWVAVDACTLPTELQPLRVAEFDALFGDALRGVDRVSPTRLSLNFDATAEDRARELAAQESGCCSFFTFGFTSAGTNLVRMDIDVPPARVEVLDGLAARASAGRPA